VIVHRPAKDAPGGEREGVSLDVDIELPLAGFTLAARFASDAGVTALFGRSGAGKTTIIDCIAGLRRPARGRVAVAGQVLFDSARGIDVPRHRRRVGYVFQDARLFPHLTVRRNLLYGRWFRRTSSPVARARCRAASASASPSAAPCSRPRASC